AREGERGIVAEHGERLDEARPTGLRARTERRQPEATEGLPPDARAGDRAVHVDVPGADVSREVRLLVLAQALDPGGERVTRLRGDRARLVDVARGHHGEHGPEELGRVEERA